MKPRLRRGRGPAVVEKPRRSLSGRRGLVLRRRLGCGRGYLQNPAGDPFSLGVFSTGQPASEQDLVGSWSAVRKCPRGGIDLSDPAPADFHAAW